MIKNKKIFCLFIILLLVTLSISYSKESDAKALIKKGDLLFKERHKVKGKYMPNKEAVKYAMAYYQKAFGNDPRKADNMEACWKYLQSSFFYNNYLIKVEEEKKKFLNSKYTEYCIPMMKKYPKSGEIALYGFYILGSWIKLYGIMEAIKLDASKEILKLINLAVKYSPKFQEGSPLRLLGAVHIQTPDIMSWRDIKKAKLYLETALKYSKTGSYYWKYSKILMASLYIQEYSKVGLSKDDGIKKAKDIIKEVDKHSIDEDMYTEDKGLKEHFLAGIKKKLK